MKLPLLFMLPLLAVSVMQCNTVFAQSTEPNPEINGKIYIESFLDPDHTKYKSPFNPTNEGLTVSFDRKNLTGLELARESQIFIPRETSLYWTGDLKIPIDETRTSVQDIFMIIQVHEIEETPYLNNPDQNSISYWGTGILKIGEGKWNVEAMYEPNDHYGFLRVLSN